MKLNAQQLAFIADRARAWEVRRFCQVLPSIVEYDRGQDATRPHFPRSKPNGALAALLRCLVYQLGADLAMVSLLDDHTQYFVSGATRADVQNAKITLESTQWYGCESVLHHGGLCERTITQQNCPNNMAFYEVLDMSETEDTKSLPFVNGDIARFRHYAGVPLNPYDGPNIGTVFFFREEPSEAGRSAAVRSYLSDIASHVTRHLEQAVEALQGKRVLRFNEGIAALLKIGPSNSLDLGSKSRSPNAQRKQQQILISNQHTDFALRVYELAASLLYDIFDFDGVSIQEVAASGAFTNINPDWNGSKIMAQHIGPNIQWLQEPSDVLLYKLLELFPQGAVFHIARNSGEIVAATDAQEPTIVSDDVLSAELFKGFPSAGQILLMPLWDTYHECNIGAVLGFAHDQSRIYLGSTDLSSMSAFCTTIMTQVRRLEVKTMGRIKSDFLGSISHEMRTPLHGILSSLELLADTTHSELQHDLLAIAQYSGTSLLETIDRVLYLSNISSKVEPTQRAPSGQSESWTAQRRKSLHYGDAAPLLEEDVPNIIQVCEAIIEHLVQRLNLRETVRPELFGHRRSISIPELSCVNAQDTYVFTRTPIIVFDTNATWGCRLTAKASFEVVFTNLLDNALKFNDPAGCVRIHLDIDEASVKLSLTDSGKGLAPGFIRHSVFDMFSQEDPSSEGTGLGLSLVKRVLNDLGGNIHLDSYESLGSTFTATFPLGQVLSVPSEELSSSWSNTLKSDVAEMSQLETSLFAPTRWRSEDGVRSHRCAGMMLESLAKGLRRWFDTDVTLWETSRMQPQLLFVLLEDLETVVQTCRDALSHTKLVVLCPDVEKNSPMRTGPWLGMATIAGPLTPSTLQDALAHLFPMVVPVSGSHTSLNQASSSARTQDVLARSKTGRAGHLTSTDIDEPSNQSLSDLDLRIERHSSHLTQAEALPCPSLTETPNETEAEAGKNPQTESHDIETSSEVNIPAPSDRAMREPTLLLVDDNAINLKVLTMYARKCSNKPSRSTRGGQEAIEAYNETLPGGPNASQPYDIIFLDLSMPEVSGFDVARRIRESEVRLENRSRTYICALTSLASAKDRNRAYASGVDEYLVKPTSLRELQAIVDKWRNTLPS